MHEGLSVITWSAATASPSFVGCPDGRAIAKTLPLASPASAIPRDRQAVAERSAGPGSGLSRWAAPSVPESGRSPCTREPQTYPAIAPEGGLALALVVVPAEREEPEQPERHNSMASAIQTPGLAAPEQGVRTGMAITSATSRGRSGRE